jgi:hypothetical protein
LLSSEQLAAPKDGELFGRTADLSPVNIAVNRPFRDAKAAAVEAGEIAEELFDWMQPHWTPEYPVEIDKAHYIVADSRGWIVYQHSGATFKHPGIVANSALDVSNFFEALKELVAETLKSIENTRADYPLASKLPVCLRWYRKAVESSNLEDRLLNYWIVLERAFGSSRHDRDAKWSIGNADQTGKFATIVAYVPVQDALHFMYDFGWQLHHYLDRLSNRFYTSAATNTMVPYISLSAELQRQCRFDRTARSITLDDFLPHLDRIASELTDRVVKEKVEEAALFYRDPHIAKEAICKRFESTRDEIVLIYRLRNSIVHQGHFDRKLLEPFAARAGELARLVLGLLFSRFLTDPALSVETIFTDAKVRYDRTIARLEANLEVDFVAPKRWGMYPRIVPVHETPQAGTSSWVKATSHYPVALLSRRVVQRSLNFLRKHVLMPLQADRLVSQLNGASRHVIPTEWEIIVVAASAKHGALRYEPAIGKACPDIWLESAGSDRDVALVAEVVAVSDYGTMEKNPSDFLHDQLFMMAMKLGLNWSSLGWHVGDRMEGRYPNRRLTAVGRFPLGRRRPRCRCP